MDKPHRPTLHTPRTPAILRKRFEGAQDRVADAITRASGSMVFVYVHVAWFAVWVVANEAGADFDPFPFGLLTLIVSLEAIFLSTFVMISQNRSAARAEVKTQLDFETNVRAEAWSVHIGMKLGIDPEEVEREVQAALASVPD